MIVSIGKHYNWKNQAERLVYRGKKGSWHQFAKIDEPTDIWCEVLDADLHMIEETKVGGLTMTWHELCCDEAMPWAGAKEKSMQQEIDELRAALSREKARHDCMVIYNDALMAENNELIAAMTEVVRISDRRHDAWDRAKAAMGSAATRRTA